MVEKEERYICEVCHRRYDSREAAEECEESEPEEISISAKEGETSDWQVGDLVAKGVFDAIGRLSSLAFGKIVDTDAEARKHLVKPVVKFPGKEREALGGIELENVVLLDMSEIEGLKSWMEGGESS